MYRKKSQKRITYRKNSDTPLYGGIPVAVIVSAILSNREDQMKAEFPEIITDEAIAWVKNYVLRRFKGW